MLAVPTLLAPLLAAPASAPHVVPATEPAPVHCQVPCGIYGDHLRIELLREDAATIEKAMKEIARLGAEQPVDFNQVVRWVNTKEEHAQKVQDQLARYWLAQRVKRPDLTDQSDAGADARRRYSGQLVTIHEMTVAAMKCKQTTDVANVAAFRKSLESFRKAYFKPEDLEHLEHDHGGDAKPDGAGDKQAAATGPLEAAKNRKALADLRSLGTAIDQYRLDNAGNYPASLEALTQGGATPTDPWGNAYVYEIDGTGKMRLFSLGADGKRGGDGANADIAVDR